jgi:hypothetical protein
MKQKENRVNLLTRRLPDNEIELRVQSVFASGWAILLAYKTARVDAKRLDDVVGPENWQKHYEYDAKGNLLCHIDVWCDAKKQWIRKTDVGDDNKQGAKGTYSDAFKRAGFAWGIGRELYDLPLLFIKLNDDEFEKDGNKAKATNKLRVNDWSFETSETHYQIYDDKGNRRFYKERPKKAIVIGLDPEASGILQDKINKCDTLEELTKVYEDKLPEGEIDPEILRMFTKHKKYLQGLP